MQLHFYGGVQSVTGSNFLLETDSKKILIDCGLQQGVGFCEEINCRPFPYNPEEVDAVFVTHAHIDHTGRLPKLIREGYRGKIYSTPPTRDFAELLLLDSEHIMRKETERLGEQPLYETEDVVELMKRWEVVLYHKTVSVGEMKITPYDAGHILGSAFYVVEGTSISSGQTVKVVFSGDLGNYPAPIIKPTEFINDADYCLIESTYGGRVHEELDERKNKLEKIIKETIVGGGTLLIPAFAMERTQDILYQLNELIENNRLPRVPVFLDSPLAIKLTAVYQKYNNYFNNEARELVEGGDKIFNFPGLHMALQTEQSKEINNVPNPKIIIAGSGMMQGGRIAHHARRQLPNPRSTILFIGFQAAGSLGRRILDGSKSHTAFSVKIFGEDIPINCRVEAIGGYSAHADQPRLLKWLAPMKKNIKTVFACMGEPKEATALVEKIRETLGIDAEMPEINQVVEL